MQSAGILLYLLLTLSVGLIFRRRAALSRSEFFLAGRSLPPLLLFVTMAASNFSAFTIFGLSGAGYRLGYAFFPVMGFGTGFMALSFWLIGVRIVRLSRIRGYLTPGDFIADRYGSLWLRRLFSLVMVLFTLPYVAIQTVAAGRSLEALAGFPYIAGAGLITLFIALYVSLGGLRSIAWTDLIQGGMMLLFTGAAYLLILNAAGGFRAAHAALLTESPDHLMRPGAGAGISPGIWTGYMVLWFFADPMFPHLFQRLIAAKDEKSLAVTVILYPLVTTGLFFLTVSIGVVGRHLLPGLSAAESDSVFPLLLTRAASPLIAGILLTGSIAALMSTLDSQLLTAASIISGEIDPDGRRGVGFHRLVIIALAAAGFLIALRPPQTLLAFISSTTFNGLAVLFPAVAGGLYWRRGNRYGAAASILVGETMTVAAFLGLLPATGTLPVVPVLLVSGLVYLLVSVLTGPAAAKTTVFPPPRRIGLGWLLLFGGIFVLGNDYWSWGRAPVPFAGLPLWVWWYLLSGLLLSGAFWLFISSRRG